MQQRCEEGARLRLFRSTTDDYYDAPTCRYPLAIRMLFRVVVFVLYWFSRAMWRCRVEGLDAHVARGGKPGSVIICNHTSMAEVVVIYVQLRRAGRSVRPIAKAEFNRLALAKWAFARAGAIPVERGSADVKSIRRAQRALQRGEDVLIFPEGTRVRTDDQTHKIHGGFALMASMAKAPIVPMAVCGFRDITPAGKRLMHPMPCWARMGSALELSDAPDNLKRSARVEWMEREAAQRMYALRDDLRAEHPGRF